MGSPGREEDGMEHDRPVRWGVLSTADIGLRKAIPGLLRARGCEVLAIGSRDEPRARAAAADLGIPRAYGSYDALLADPDVEAIYVPLPNHLHAPWTIAAVEAGKHVLCEKPLALTPAEAQGMADAASAAGVLLMEAFMYRHHPSWVVARELVATGRIGSLVAVDSWFSYFNDDPANIRNIAAYGGGALYDIGCYSVNLSRMLFGTEPDRVSAVVRRDPASGVDVLASGLLDFPNGTATFTCATRVEPDQRVSIYGTEGRITIDIPFNIPPDLPTRVRLTAGGDPPVAPATEIIELPPDDPYAMEAERFAEAIRAGGPAPVPPTDAVANLAVIERLFAAAEAD
jgi:predicted dehydrogenase